MSKNQKRRRQDRPFPWPFVVLGGILLIVAAFFFANQGGGGGAPAILVDQQKIDFGAVKFNTEKTFAIKVTNTGGGVLRFKEDPYIEVVEGC
jgi:hypothetical protein